MNKVSLLEERKQANEDEKKRLTAAKLALEDEIDKIKLSKSSEISKLKKSIEDMS